MAMVLMFIKVFLIVVFLNLYVVLRVWIDELCIVPLAPAVVQQSNLMFECRLLKIGILTFGHSIGNKFKNKQILELLLMASNG
jgi:hypothetical protein